MMLLCTFERSYRPGPGNTFFLPPQIPLTTETTRFEDPTEMNVPICDRREQHLPGEPEEKRNTSSAALQKWMHEHTETPAEGKYTPKPNQTTQVSSIQNNTPLTQK